MADRLSLSQTANVVVLCAWTVLENRWEVKEQVVSVCGQTATRRVGRALGIIVMIILFIWPSMQDFLM